MELQLAQGVTDTSDTVAMQDELPRFNSAEPATQPADESSDSVLSSLSELEEDAVENDMSEDEDDEEDEPDDILEDENEDSIDGQDPFDNRDVSDGDKSEEYDTEAETEKLEHPLRSGETAKLLRRHSVDESALDDVDELCELPVGAHAGSHRRLASMMVTLKAGPSDVDVSPLLPNSLARKRRRPSSTSDAFLEGEDMDDTPRKRRSISGGHMARTADRRRSLYNDNLESDAKESDGSIGHSSEPENLSPLVAEDDEPEDLTTTAPLAVEPKTIFAEEAEAIEDDKESIKSVDEGEEELTGKVLEEEHDDDVKPDVEGDELDPATRNEDELAKKKNAMQSWRHIETLFAIFRDKLFDERLHRLDEELAHLNGPLPTHLVYLEMQKCLVTRRNEKIELEKTSLKLKTGALQKVTMAERAIANSQYFQEIREIRDKSLSTLNQRSCALHKERKTLFAQDPHYVYTFEPRRSRQVAAQAAYNKEVSLLAGIARHRGFPAAPEMPGVSVADAEGDIRAMKMSRPTSRMASIAQAVRAEDAAAEEQFLEKTPWANPYHPIHQQALLLERQASATGLSQLPTTRPGARIETPSMQRRMADVHYGSTPGMDTAHMGPGSASTIVASDPPSTNGPVRRGSHKHGPRGASHGFGSSPYDRRSAQQQQHHHHGSSQLNMQGSDAPSERKRPAMRAGSALPTEHFITNQSFSGGTGHNGQPANGYGGTPYTSRAGNLRVSGPNAALTELTSASRREANPFASNSAGGGLGQRPRAVTVDQGT